MIENVAILSAVRTPIGKAKKGVFKNIRPDDLGAFALKGAIEKSNIDKNLIEDIIFGCAMPEAEQGMNIGRIIGLRAGLSQKISAATINRFCSSGLHAVADIAKSIVVSQIKYGAAGGVESMSMVPMGGHKPSANPYLMEHNPDVYMAMGLTAERVAKEYGISRAYQDEFSLKSHQKACIAIKEGYFEDEIVPVNVGDLTIDKDEGPRSDTSLEVLAKLKPAFMKDGTVTAGNSSQVSDGAASVILGCAQDAKEKGYDIKGYFRDFTTAGVDPALMGIGPVFAINKLLKKVSLSIKDIGVFEINEAFAAQAAYCVDELGIDHEKVNPLGGAIALGHPLGCTGARQVATILQHMQRKGIRYGICSMCVGGGMGAAALIELA